MKISKYLESLSTPPSSIRSLGTAHIQNQNQNYSDHRHIHSIRFPYFLRNEPSGNNTMMKSALIRSCPSPLLVEPTNARGSSSTKGAISCSTRINACGNIPKLEPFSRRKVERALKEPPLIQKCENELADYCSTLEGDGSYSCWSAYFELRELEKEIPKEEVERLIVEAGGVKSLIGFLHGVAEIHRGKKNISASTKPTDTEKGLERLCPIPDGLPKSREEIEEEERSRMPDSPFTRLLRTKGTHPAWYTQAPDHETD